MKRLETVLIFCFLVVFFSNSALIASQSKIMLTFWFESLVPSMFVCIFLIQLLSSTSFFIALSKPFRFLCPLLNLDGDALGLVFSCLLIGAPSSTLLINEAYQKEEISEKMALRLLFSLSVSTVSFLIMSAGTQILKSQSLGVMLWLIQMCSAFVLLWLTRSTPILFTQKKTQKKHSFSSALLKTGTTLFLIGGYLLVFQTLCTLVSAPFHQSIQSFIRIISEFSYGCQLIAKLFGTHDAFVLISTLCGFNGLCVQFQSLSMSELKIPVFKYVCFRMLQALLSLVFSAALLPLL